MSSPSNSNSVSGGQRNGVAARTQAPDKIQTDDGFADGAIIKSLAVELTSVYPLPSRSTIRRGRTGPSISEDELKVPDLSVDQVGYLNLTTHSDNFLADPIDLKWGEEDSEKRGPVLATTRHPTQRNAIGAHSGSYCLYRALAVACGKLNPNYLPKLEATRPVCEIGPFDSWSDPSKIGTMDPWGHMVTSEYRPWLNKGYDIRPTIAVTKAHIDLPEVKEAVRVGRLKPDGKILNEDGQSFITKCAVEPVWYLPEIARRFGVDEVKLRETLFRETNMMFPELVTREDLKAFLPPIGGLTIYIFGDPASIPDEDIPLTVRVHDECNGSDVFGSDICTCRPYLTHAIEECIKTAQEGGTGVCIYFRKEGRSLGEVTKYLVYNMRKRQEGGDSAEKYFNCTEQVAGIQDTRFQALMPDALHWLGVTKIHRFISMSDMKYDAIVSTGIKIVERVEIPPELVPKDAQVEIMAKVFKGYHAGSGYVGVNDDTMRNTLGRTYGQASNESAEVNGGGAELTSDEPYPDRTSMRRQRGPSISEDELKVPDLSVDQVGYLNLTTHSANFLADPIDLKWGEEDPEKRGPIIATTRQPTQRNAIGAHSGSYCLYRALAVACGKLDPNYLPKLDATRPVCEIGPFESWSDASKIGTMDPWGHVVTDVYKPWLRKGYDIRPTIAVTEAHIDLPEVREAVRVGRLKPDGKILTEDGQSFITKCAVEPVWYLPEIARRFGVDEVKLRETLFKETNMMYPELVTREDLKVFLPPIGGLTVYIFGDPALIPNEDIPLTVRVHDECNGSDVFGSDICTCRPYLTHAIEECIKTAQEGGTGICIYFRKEGRSLGEVTKYLVYNMRKRQEGGDSAEKYFNCTEQVAGIQDTRFQAMMPDALHWLGVTKIHRFISMSDMKYDAIVSTGIKIVERVEIPPELVPKDAQVEITAKVFQGYHAGLGYVGVNKEALKTTLGRGYDYDEEKSRIPDADTNVT